MAMEPQECFGSSAAMDCSQFPYIQQRSSKSANLNESINTSSLGTVDSGYGSLHCETNVQSQYVETNSPAMASPQVLQTSKNLLTIEEGIEANESVKLTPVTQNIRKITAFHITTPKSDCLQSGVKRQSVTSLDFENFENTPKKFKEIDRKSCKPTSRLFKKYESLTPRKVDKLKNTSQSKTFRKKLKSAPDLDSYFSRNDGENAYTPRKRALSPIFNKQSSKEVRTPLANTTNSHLQFSTPKTFTYEETSKSKASSVKKILTFTDNQFGALLNSAVEKSTGVCEATDSFELYESELEKIINEECKNDKNSFHLCFSKEQEDRIVRDCTTPTRNISGGDSENSMLLKTPELIREVVKTQNQNALAVNNYLFEIPKENTLNESKFGFSANFEINQPNCIESSQSNKPLKSIKITSLEEKKTEFFLENSKISSNEMWNKIGAIDSKPKTNYKVNFRTPSKYKKLLKLNDRNTDKCKQVDAKKPRKWFSGNTHLNIIKKLRSYPQILDRIFNMLSSQDLLYCSQVANSWQVAVRDNYDANRRLSEFLSECKNTKENKKSNKSEPRPIIRVEVDNKCAKDAFTDIRVPFSQVNFRIDRKRCLEAEKSPPVSPSKRKFYENQKVVRTLAANEKLIKCPRCQKSSRVVNSPSQQSVYYDQGSVSNINNNNNISNTNNNSNSKTSDDILNNLQSAAAVSSMTTQNFIRLSKCKKAVSFDDGIASTMSMVTPVSFHTNEMDTIVKKRRPIKSKSIDSAFMPSITSELLTDGLIGSSKRLIRRSSENLEFLPFGECTGILCSYRFCLKCECDYHPGTNCKLAPSSPSKDDLQNGILQLNLPYSGNTISGRSTKALRRRSMKRLFL